jgi:threonine synthase
VNSLNQYRIEGQKSGAFEICDVLGDAPDYFCIPVGNAGNITSYWKGFREYHEAGKIKKLPRMLGFQAEGSAPIVRGYVIEKPETKATAIRIGKPGKMARSVQAANDSGGKINYGNRRLHFRNLRPPCKNGRGFRGTCLRCLRCRNDKLYKIGKNSKRKYHSLYKYRDMVLKILILQSVSVHLR